MWRGPAGHHVPVDGVARVASGSPGGRKSLVDFLERAVGCNGLERRPAQVLWQFAGAVFVSGKAGHAFASGAGGVHHKAGVGAHPVGDAQGLVGRHPAGAVGLVGQQPQHSAGGVGQVALQIRRPRHGGRQEDLLAHLKGGAVQHHVFDLQIDAALGGAGPIHQAAGCYHGGQHGFSGGGHGGWFCAGGVPANAGQRAVGRETYEVAQHPLVGGKVHHARDHHAVVGLKA